MVMLEVILYLLGFILLVVGITSYIEWREKQDLKWYVKMHLAERNIIYEDLKREVDSKADAIRAKEWEGR